MQHIHFCGYVFFSFVSIGVVCIEYGAGSSNCCHGVNRNEWCPVASQRSLCPSPTSLELELQKQENEIILKMQVLPLPLLDTIRLKKTKKNKTRVSKSRQSGGCAVTWLLFADMRGADR